MAAPMRPLTAATVKSLHTASWQCAKETMRKTMKKSSSNQWLTRQINDPYVKRAEEDGYRCRSAYKLKEINDKFHLIRLGDVVIDCGAAPGSWSQIAAESVFSGRGLSEDGENGKVIAVDLQHIKALTRVHIINQCDFTASDTQDKIMAILDKQLADVVLSDMAPSASSSNQLDHDNICKLCLSVLEFSTKVLKQNGHVVCKLWDGQDRDKILNVMKRMFRDVRIVKPKASRPGSAEIFLVGQKYFLRKT